MSNTDALWIMYGLLYSRKCASSGRNMLEDIQNNCFRELGYRHKKISCTIRENACIPARYRGHPLFENLQLELTPANMKAHPKPETEAFIQRCFRRIDAVYFFGILHKRGVTIKREDKREANYYGFWARNGRNKIFLNWSGTTSAMNNPRRTEIYFGTLVHEMVHAFIHHTICRPCMVCAVEYNPELGGQGYDGHGPVFLDCLAEVQEAITRDTTVAFTCRKIEQHAYLETLASGWKPEYEERRKWKLSGQILVKTSSDFRDIHREELLEIEEEVERELELKGEMSNVDKIRAFMQQVTPEELVLVFRWSLGNTVPR